MGGLNVYKYIKGTDSDGVNRMQHRIALEQFMNRKLKPSETVHHINWNKSDNRIINLMLFETRSDHARFHKYFKCTIEGIGDPNDYKDKEKLMDILYENYGILFYGELHHEDIKKNALKMAERMKLELGLVQCVQ